MLLTGFHTWTNLVDMRREGRANAKFDFDAYLDMLSEFGHNHIRLWAWDALCSWDPNDRVESFPWERTGPGLAVDGQPKIDFDTFDEDYFARLRSRVSAAAERGIYVGVMLFESWAACVANTTPKEWHVTAPDNNINGIDGLASIENHWMMGWMGLADPAITAIQDRLIARVVTDLNEFDNVIYEVSNEAGRHSYAWQQHVVDQVRAVEAGLPKQHLVGITGGMGTRDPEYYDNTADYLAPEGWAPEGEGNVHRDGFATWGDAPERGTVPILLDTDHLWGIGGNVRWAWQSFLRGYHVLYMDPITDLPSAIFEHPWWPDSSNVDLRAELGAIGRLARSLDLNACAPASLRSSSGYALWSPDAIVSLSLAGAPLALELDEGEFEGEWRECVTGNQVPVRTSGGRATLANPFAGDATVTLRRA